MAQTLAYVRDASEPEDPPPMLLSGPLLWAKANLFSSIGSGLTTVAFIALALWLLPPMIAWATTLAVWSAPDGSLMPATPGRRLLGVHCGKARLLAVWLVSAGGALARGRCRSPGGEPDRLVALA